MSFPRYPAYKPSGVEWLGDVPEHWNICALNYRYEVELGKMLDEKRITGNHLAPYLRNTDVQWSRINVEDLPQMDFANGDLERYSLKRGDLLVCEGGEVGRAAIWDAPLAECYYQKALHRIRARDSSCDSARFLSSIFAAVAALGVFSGSGGKSTIAHLPAETLRRYRFPFPPLPEQEAITAFLDRETGKIDALVAEQRRLMELLKEKRQAVISHAVTRGLNPKAKLKPSGNDWIGEMPKHWRISMPKHFTSKIVDGVHFKPNYVSEGVPFVTVRNLTAGLGISFDDLNYITKADHEEFFKRANPEKGDVLITKDGATLGVARVVETDRVFSIFVSVALLKPIRDLVDPWFLSYALESTAVFQQFKAGEQGSALKHIHLVDLRNVWVALPPIAEQRAIVQTLNERIVQFETLFAEAQRAIDLLQERRTALISAAVTGQIDVREAAATC